MTRSPDLSTHAPSSSASASPCPSSSSWSATSPCGGGSSSQICTSDNTRKTINTQPVQLIFKYFLRTTETRESLHNRDVKLSWTLFSISFCYVALVGPMVFCSYYPSSIYPNINLICHMIYFCEVSIIYILDKLLIMMVKVSIYSMLSTSSSTLPVTATTAR